MQKISKENNWKSIEKHRILKRIRIELYKELNMNNWMSIKAEISRILEIEV